MAPETSTILSRPLRSRAEPEVAAVPRPRPALLLGLLAGLVAVLGPVLLACGLGLAGWYLSDGGGHGSAGDGSRAGAAGWLVAHGSGFTVDGVVISVVPLALTAGIAWWIWRTGVRVGEQVWAHGPDAHRLADGERDWTVLVTVIGFATSYLTGLAIVGNLVTSSSFAPRWGSVIGWGVALVALVAAPAVATGSGRAATWASQLPPVVRHGASTARRVLTWYLLACTFAYVLALGLRLGSAVDMVRSLGLSGGEAFQYVLLNAAFAPNAVLLTSAFLLGPGFALGVSTLVSPASVVLGPLPLLPILAAVPDPGVPPAWWGAHLVVPVLVAAAAAWRHQSERPTLRWDEGALRGCGAGLVAAAVLALLTSVAGGAAGPGRLREVGASASEVGLSAVVWLGLGALVGALLMTWWQRHTSVPVDAPVDALEDSPETGPVVGP